MQHFFFWLTGQSSQLHWSRETTRRRSHTATVYEVHSGPSSGLRQNSAYSPDELHQHVFWVSTDIGVLDLLAYNETAYNMWVSGLGKIAQGTPDTESEGTLGDKISPGGLNTAPLEPQPKKFLGHKTRRSAVVAPALVIENEARDASSLTITGTGKPEGSCSTDSDLTPATPHHQRILGLINPLYYKGPPNE